MYMAAIPIAEPRVVVRGQGVDVVLKRAKA